MNSLNSINIEARIIIMAIKELKGINKRPRYFAGQYLLEDDFELEQDYSRDRLQRYTRSLHISGISDGLIASKPNDATLKLAVDISAGTAIDPKGRQVVLLESRQVDLSKDLVESVQLDNGFYILFISYDEQESDPQDGNTSTNRRILENPIFKLINFSTSPPNDDSIAITKLTIQDGNVSIPGDSNSVRKYTGLRLPTLENTNAPTLRSKGGNLAVFSGSLEIAGSQTVGSTTLESHLYLSGGTGPFAQFYRDAIDGKDYLGIEAFKQNDSQTKSAIVLQEFGGNVGIGTTSPSEKLDVSGNIKTTGSITGNSLSVGIPLVSESGNTQVRTGSTANIDLSGHVQFKEYADSNIAFLQARDDRLNRNIGLQIRTQKQDLSGTRILVDALRIAPSGNVGIGTTDPSAKLTIQTPEPYTGNTLRFETQTQSSLYSLNLNTNVTNNVVRWVFDQKNNTTTYSNVLAFDRGNIGIGTATPLQTLDVNGRIHVNNGVIQRGGTAITNTNDLGLYSQEQGQYIRFVTQNAPLRFYTDGGIGTTTRMSIEANGNVAIATASPTENSKLEIAGTSGNVFSAGIPLVSGSGTTQTRTGSTANIDLCGHVQIKEYGNLNVAYLQARDDRVNRNISLKIRTQKAGTSQREITEAMTIDPDGNVSISGRLSCGTKLIEMTKYTEIGDNTNYQTGYSTSDWICSIAGFHSGVGDINESGSGQIIQVYAYPHGNGFWHIRADFFTHNKGENWTIWLMAIRRDIARATNDL
jgi:hypothetical protein